MSNFLGYGEDAFTLWALKNKKKELLEEFQDKTSPSDCLVFYRPSFGRSGGKQSAEFGEFDAILVSKENVYLLESKWDNLADFKKSNLVLRKEQLLRHQIFQWYLKNWESKYFKKWESFEKDKNECFIEEFAGKRFVPSRSLLAKNLEFILTSILNHFGKSRTEMKVKNILLFFYNKKISSPPVKISEGFNVVSIDYGQNIIGNFISLD